MMNQQVKDFIDSKRELRLRDMEGMDLLEELVVPLLPHTLEECFEVNYLDFGFSRPPVYLRFDFGFKKGVDMELALGTITKVKEALDRDGWENMTSNTRKFSEESIQIDIAGSRRMEDRTVRLLMSFENLEPTDQCKLVEEEVWVEEVPAVEAIARHQETRMKLVCEEDNDNNPDVG